MYLSSLEGVLMDSRRKLSEEIVVRRCNAPINALWRRITGKFCLHNTSIFARLLLRFFFIEICNLIIIPDSMKPWIINNNLDKLIGIWLQKCTTITNIQYHVGGLLCLHNVYLVVYAGIIFIERLKFGTAQAMAEVLHGVPIGWRRHLKIMKICEKWAVQNWEIFAFLKNHI